MTSINTEDESSIEAEKAIDSTAPVLPEPAPKPHQCDGVKRCILYYFGPNAIIEKAPPVERISNEDILASTSLDFLDPPRDFWSNEHTEAKTLGRQMQRDSMIAAEDILGSTHIALLSPREDSSASSNPGK